MTGEEVEAILGVPDVETILGVPDDHIRKSWVSDDAIIEIGFDERGLVVWKGYVPLPPLEESIWQKLRRWLRIN